MTEHARDERLQWIYSSSSNSELEQRYDQWADLYDKDIADDLKFIGPAVVAKAFVARVSPEAIVLDAGAGTGAVGVELAKLGFKHITAIDLSTGMLEVAKSKGVYEGAQREVLGTRLGFSDDHFDGTICVGTLTIGHAPPESLDEFIRVTKPGGTIAFSMRPDHYESGGFKAKQEQLERARRWKLVSHDEPYNAMPGTDEVLMYQTWVYEVLV